MTRYRLDALAYAVALSFAGLAVAAAIVLRSVADAIDAACAMPNTDTVPDTVPEWMNEEADL